MAPRSSEAKQEVESGRREVADGRKQLAQERRRLRVLLKRMRQRYHRHWAAEREAIDAREADVARQHHELEQARARLERDVANMMQGRLRLNGDVELARRQLKEEWAALRQEELGHDESQARQSAELDQLRHSLDHREASLSEVQEELEEQRLDWREVRQELEREVEGLEARAKHHRRQVSDLHAELTKLQSAIVALAPPIEVPAIAPPAPACTHVAAGSEIAQLERIAGDLADQRAHLAEQWQRLLLVQQHWQQHYQALVRELEAAGRHLLERDRGIKVREQGLESAEKGIRLRQRDALELQRQLEAWQARMTARESAWTGERDRFLNELHARQKLAERRLAEIRLLHERWTKRRRRELAWLQNERGTAEKVRQECADLRDDWFKRGAALQEEQRSLAERSLALEQYQQETMGQATNPASAERRLQRLRIRWAGQLAKAQKSASAERQRIESDATNLQERQVRYQKHLARLNQREEELSEKLRKWEEDRLQVGDELARLRQELEVARRIVTATRSKSPSCTTRWSASPGCSLMNRSRCWPCRCEHEPPAQAA